MSDERYRRYMLIESVTDDRGKHITPHMWMPMRDVDYVGVSLCRRDAIQFSAEVERYTKGSLQHRKIDYGLCKPANVERIEQVETEQDA